MKNKIEQFWTSCILYNIICIIFILIPIILATGVTIDYIHGIKYEELPLYFVWPFSVIVSIGIFSIWSIGWKKKLNKN